MRAKQKSTEENIFAPLVVTLVMSSALFRVGHLHVHVHDTQDTISYMQIVHPCFT